jgi:hypothetical protein
MICLVVVRSTHRRPLRLRTTDPLALEMIRRAASCPTHTFEFCGWWFRPVRLGLVAPEPRLSNPLRTPLNLCE